MKIDNKGNSLNGVSQSICESVVESMRGNPHKWLPSVHVLTS